MKTNTLKQRLALYKSAHEQYQKKNSIDEFLCHLFECFDAKFREMPEVIEITSKKQRNNYIMFNSDSSEFITVWEVRNKFLLKLIKHTEKKIAQGKK